MPQTLDSLLLDPRLKLRTADALPSVALERFSLKTWQIHEWFLDGDLSAHLTKTPMHSANTGATHGAGSGNWCPPLTVMAALAYREMAAPADANTPYAHGTAPRVIWIGRKCWPTFQIVHAFGAGALERSVFLCPPNDPERFWAIGQALRCPAVRAVIADGSGMNETTSRRLQLAAQTGMALALIARPPWEKQRPSCAATRWQVRPARTHDPGGVAGVSKAPAWTIELLRCRGQRAGQDAPQSWQAEYSYQVCRGSVAFNLSADVGCGTGTSALARSGGSGGEQALPRTA